MRQGGSVSIGRRQFLLRSVSVGAGLTLAVYLPACSRAQMEGGMGFALSAALSGEITLHEGRVVQSNFHDYSVLGFDQMPSVEVHIVRSAQAPTGVGEPATPVIAPAVANALYHATGQRFGKLPPKLSV